MSETGKGDNHSMLGDFQVEFANEMDRDPTIEAKINSLVTNMQSQNVEVNPITTEYFTDPDLLDLCQLR